MTGLLAWLVQYVLQLVSRVFHGVLDVFFHVTVGGLGFAGHLVHNTFLAKGLVARDLASNFLDIALDLVNAAFNLILVHTASFRLVNGLWCMACCCSTAMDEL